MSDNVAVAHPEVEFIRPCNLCPHMKRITLPKILASLEHLQHEVTVDPAVAAGARRAVERNARGRPRGGGDDAGAGAPMTGDLRRNRVGSRRRPCTTRRWCAASSPPIWERRATSPPMPSCPRIAAPPRASRSGAPGASCAGCGAPCSRSRPSGRCGTPSSTTTARTWRRARCSRRSRVRPGSSSRPSGPP